MWRLQKGKTMKKGILKDLFLSFAKIGMFTFGGGYAMIALIENECVENKKWITTDDLSTITAIAESTPGPIAINSATFVGYKVCGVWGSFFSTLGIVLPSFVIIILISFVLREFEQLSEMDKSNVIYEAVGKEVYKTNPVDIDTFITDPDYLGSVYDNIFKIWRDLIREIYPAPFCKKYDQVILSCATRCFGT